MDSIDEWMTRTMGGEAPKKTSSHRPQNDKRKHPFKKSTKPGVAAPTKSAKPQHAKKTHAKPNDAKQTHHKRKPHHAKPHRQHGKAHSQHKAKAGGRTRLPVAKPTKRPPILKGKVKIIPLGGLDEVGKNMMAIEYEDDIVLIDMGFEFPDDDLLGIDYVIPDVSYLEENKKRIRGVLLTHAHLDHIGGIPYILPKLDFPPIYGTKLTIGFVEHRIKEFKQEKFAKLHVVNTDIPLKLGKFICRFIRVAHSIPDATSLVIETPVGKIVHTGDFKFDESPARNMTPAENHKLEALGKENVLALLCESTNSVVPGHTISEKVVGETLDKAIGATNKRILIASFSSQLGRVQQIIDAAAKHGRKVFVGGRSMKNNINIASKLGYLKVPKNLVSDIKKYDPKKNPDSQTLIVTTGSQGEDLAALSRISRNEHSQIRIKKGDIVIFSSSPIPGNEKAIYGLINNLCILGAKIIHNKMQDVHTSGHAKQDELKRMINYVKPRYLVPIHGEFFMRQALATLAQEECGIPENRIIMIQNGDVLVAEKDKLSRSKDSVDTKYILIDGTGEGQMDSQVLVDRQIMSKNGALTVLVSVNKKTRKIQGMPDVVSRGFIYQHETNEIVRDVSEIARDAYTRIRSKNPGAKRGDIKKYIRQSVDKYTHRQLARTPLIIPLIIES